MYIWELADWPRFRWDGKALVQPLASAQAKRDLLLERMEHLSFELRREMEVLTVTEEVLKSAEIEGEVLNRESVRSCVRGRLGVPDAERTPVDRQAEGMVEMVLDAARNCAAPLTRGRLWTWQAGLFPGGYPGLRSIKTSGWRDDSHGPMQIVSGPLGRERIHFQAPPAAQVEAEMTAFLAWVNAPPAMDGLVAAALAHLWLVTIHPFEDGNGRIARALMEMSLARSENSPNRFYSLSSQIRRERANYYDVLERTEKGDLDVTAWLRWFIDCFSRALDVAEQACASVLRKAEFWQCHALTPLNERQRKVLNRFLGQFEGKLTARKWSALAKCSIATAQRDIKELVDQGVLVRNEGGSENASYTVAAS